MGDLLDRFIRYVQVETTADDESAEYPSSPGQRTLAEQLARELRELKLNDVRVDQHAIVWGTIPATAPKAPTIAWFAHMDTSPEFTARNVKPIVHRNYDGGDITLPGDTTRVLRVSENPDLARQRGRTLITTDGTTLLGADDKCGVAVIGAAAERLMADRGLQHGPIRVIFTCDEEIGRGCDKLNVAEIGAVCGYTLDGESAGLIEAETFSADQATVTITGRNTHPGYATGRMVNAIRVASEFVSRLPWRRLAPETTSGREGFLHPYTIEGGVEQARMKVLLRSFDTHELAQQAKLLHDVAATVLAEHPQARIDIDIKQQYRNMAEALKREPRAVELAAEATRRAGLEPQFKSIRGGTDGSRLSEMGLPTPNLSTGMHNFHSPLEYAVLEEMQAAVDTLVHLAQLWASRP